MKKVMTILTALSCAAIMLTGCSKKDSTTKDSAKTPQDLILATGGTSGTYYAFGGVLANLWNSKIEGMNVTAESTGASKENLRNINNDAADFAIVQNDVLDYAYNGTDMFAGEKITKALAVGTLYPEVVQIAVSKNANIKTVADLKGKRVSTGDAGSGVEFNAKQILEAYGITFDDIIQSHLSFKDSAEGIQNGTLDACFITAGVPNPALQETAVSAGIVLISVEEEKAKTISEKYSFYTTTTIPANTYEGTGSDVRALAIKATLVASTELSEDTVYDLTKAIFENLDELGTNHAKGKEVSAAAAVTGISVPFHPGAIKYYKEAGLMKD